MYPEYHDGFGPFHWLLFVFLLLVVAGLAWLLVSLVLGRIPGPHTGGSVNTGGSVTPHTPTAIETLDLRYARGEVSREEYLQARADLGAPVSSG